MYIGRSRNKSVSVGGSMISDKEGGGGVWNYVCYCDSYYMHGDVLTGGLSVTVHRIHGVPNFYQTPTVHDTLELYRICRHERSRIQSIIS